MMIEPRVTAAHVEIDVVVLRQVDEVEAVGRRNAHPPIDGTERGVAAEDVERRPERRHRQVRSTAAEKAFAPLILRADAARRRQVASLEQRIAHAGERKEGPLTEN